MYGPFFIMAGYCIIWMTWLLNSLTLHSQSLSGRIAEPGGKPLVNANVLLSHLRDSSLVKGAVSDSTGLYRIEKMGAGSFLITYSLTGYKTVYLPVMISGEQHYDLPVIEMPVELKELHDVRVVTTRAFLEQRIDRTIMNVANSIVSTGGSGLDALEKAPGIVVDRQNGLIAFRGRDGVMIQIDGRPTYLAMADVITLLQNLPASEIDRIEFMANPAARYDAEGSAGIISIYRKKKEQGTNGSFSITAGMGRHARQQANWQLNHRSKKINLFGSYGFNRGDRGYWHFDLNRDWTENGVRNLVSNISTVRFFIHGHQATAGMDFSAGRRSTLGILWSGSWYYQREKAPSDVRFRHAADQPVYYHTYTAKTILDKSNNQVANVNFSHKGHRSGRQVTADLDLGRFNRFFNNTLLTTTNIPDTSNDAADELLTEMPVTIDILSFKADYTAPIADKWKWETGIKISQVESVNDMRLFSGKSGHLLPDTNLSNYFKYTERLMATYLVVSGKWKSLLDMQFGMRGEHTLSKSHEVKQHNIITRRYFNLFPSAFISHAINDTQQIILSYSYRIQRPDYQSLNPARSYLDPFAFSAGNPFLQPAYTHSLELRYGYRNKIFISVGASFTHHYVYKLVQPVNDIQTERKPFNIGRLNHYNLSFSSPLTFSNRWKAQFSATGAYGRLRYIFLQQHQIARQVYARMECTNTWSFNKGWSTEVNGWLVTPGITGGMLRNPWLGVMTIGLQKSWPSRWKLRVSASDIFHTDRWAGHFHNAGFYFRHVIVRDTRTVLASLSWSFGQNSKSPGRRRTGSEEELKRTGSN